jgi:hypothetical protein
MKICQTLWTCHNDLLSDSFGWLSAQHHLIARTYNYLKIKQLYPNIEFYYMKRTISISLLICLFACSTEKPGGEYPVIDVIGSVGNYQRVYMSDYFSSIELIPLETNENCLLDMGYFYRISLNDSIIIMRGNNRRLLYAFDRTTGKFRNQIGNRGQGPGEYNVPGDIFFNKDKSTVFVTEIFGRNLFEYDFNGRFIRSFLQPTTYYAGYGENVKLNGYAHLGGNLFIGSEIYTGSNEYLYRLFDDNGTIVHGFPNHIFYNLPMNNNLGSSAQEQRTMWIDDQLYLKHFVNDTIYVFENRVPRPAYVFDFGRYSFPLKDYESPNALLLPENAFIMWNIFVGTPRFFFYNLLLPDGLSAHRQRVSTYPWFGDYSPILYGIYDRVQNKNILLDTDQHHQHGIVNDLNGGFPFIPRYYAGNGEVVGVWNSYEMLEILTEDYFSKQTIKDPEAYQKLRRVLSKMVEDDNPVIVIAKLK